MNFEQLVAFSVFATIASVTPGPNNMMILASGLNYGFVRSLPHLAGICIGFTFMLTAAGLGLSTVFEQVPVLQTILKYGGAIYMLWLAWQLAHASPIDTDQARTDRPMTFFGAAAFQWINPKAWVMGVGALTTYLPHSFGMADVMSMSVFFGLVTAPCVAIWAVFGHAMRRVLQNPQTVRIFNVTMALLLVASLYPIFTE